MSMAVRADPAIRFWLAFAEAEGALWEEAGDKVVVLLPERLAEACQLDEEVAVTADADVAREDGALLLMSGHHVLDRAATRVLDLGDVGEVRLPWPATGPPAAGHILARARERVGVDHGRIDPSGEPPASAWLPLLRVGAIVRYRLSLEERFQEREEAWVDARTGLPVPEEVVARLDRASAGLGGEPAGRRVLPTDLERAVAGAHRVLESRGALRRDELARQAVGAMREELGRAGAYYEGVLASIARRRAVASPERQAVLDEQARVARTERVRRIQEIEEQFRPEHEVRPFRLHLVLVPAVTLSVLVRRGDRVYPFALTWMLHPSTLAPVACPHCGAAEGLVAGRERLGCRVCLPRRSEPAPAVGPAAVPKHPRNGSGGREQDVAAAPPPRAEARRSRPSGSARRTEKPSGRPPDRPLTSSAAEKAGRRLAGHFWEAMVRRKRWPRKAVVPGSPFSILDQLYGADAPAAALAVPPGATPIEATMATLGRDPLQPRLTTGHVLVSGDWYPYVILWRSIAGTACVEEVLPTADPMARLPRRADLHPDLVERLFDGVPAPLVELDPVARALWDVELPLRGLPFVARCIATMRRVENAEVLARHPHGVLAAAVGVATARTSGLRPKLPEAAQAHGADPGAVGEALADLRSCLA